MTQDRRKDDKLPEGPLVFTDRNLTAAGLAHLEAEKAAACLVHAGGDVWVGVGTKGALRGLLSEDTVSQSQAVPSELASDWPTHADLLAEDLEKIAEGWTGCIYNSGMFGEIDIGEDLRGSFAKLKLIDLFSHSAATGKVPEGWKLVPVEPSEEMVVAFAETWFSKVRCIDEHDMTDAYSAMLAAAPAAPFAGKAEPSKQTDGWRYAPLAAAVPAEEASDVQRDADRYRWLRNQQSWGNVVYEAIGYGGGEDFDKAIDAAMGFTPEEISPALHNDEALRKTEGYRLGHMEGVARKQVDILEIANERRAVELTAKRMADNLSDKEKEALDRLDKPEWRAASNLKLRAILAVEVANCIRMGAKIENLQDELRATEGYRRGYTDGATDAARIADVQNDWRSIWDEAPVQGEGALATDGATVVAARWFATGWAKHDHFSDEVEYLPEGWVTHWKPFPAAPTTDTTAQGEE